MSKNKMIGLVMTVLSVLGAFYSITTYAEDTSGYYRYSYQPPFTTHEIVVIAVAIISGICIFVGLRKLVSKEED